MSYDPTAAKNKIGRGSKLSMELIEEVLNLIEAGNYVEVSCLAVGITESTYYNWLRRGKDLLDDWGTDVDAWPDWLNEYDAHCMVLTQGAVRAQARSEAMAVATVRKAMKDDYRAAIAWLERRHPGRWSRRTEVHMSQNGLVAAGEDAKTIENPDAVKHMHDALALVAGDEPPVDAEVIDAEADALLSDETASQDSTSG